MAIGSGLERRGAVYYWRKRLPEFLARRIGANQLRYSLKTKDLAAARYLAASLNAAAADVMLDELANVTKAQLTTVFLATLKEHSRKLAVLADLSRNDPTFDIEEEARDETAMGWSYRLLSRHGASVAIGPKVVEELREAGLDAASVEAVCNTLRKMKENGQHRPSQFRIAEAMTAAGISMSAATVAKVEPVYLRALGEALLETKSRYDDDPIDYASLAAGPSDREAGVSMHVYEPASVSQGRGGHASDEEGSEKENKPGPCVWESEASTDRIEKSRHDIGMSSGASVDDRTRLVVEPICSSSIDRSSAELREDQGTVAPVVAPFTTVTDEIERIGTKLIAAKVGENEKDREWDEKTVRQARMIFDLLARFLTEERAIASLASLSQADLDAFDGFLRVLFKSYGKSPADRMRSIVELRSIAATKPADERGLSGQTRNRHLTFIGQLLRRAKSSGLKLDPDLDLSEFRAKKTKRGRDDRPVPKREQIETFFLSPIFTGCRDWNVSVAATPPC